jgi:hypothetical protein
MEVELAVLATFDARSAEAQRLEHGPNKGNN